ncbi:MAG: Rieske 2Fe-2S domain-containing protein [Rhodopirellula sp.]|nr:Rieske 2Fe-2S domain-containing protein [Rhodopirellula sp.]
MYRLRGQSGPTSGNSAGAYGNRLGPLKTIQPRPASPTAAPSQVRLPHLPAPPATAPQRRTTSEQTSTALPGKTETHWYRVARIDEIADGSTLAVQAGARTIALTLLNGQFGAIDGRCPHQGGPLAEGVLEDGLLRCPWHGWGFDPRTGESASPHHESVGAYDVETRPDGVYVAVAEAVETSPTVSDVMVETMVHWGVRHVFGMVGHSNLGMAEAIRKQETQGNITFFGIRHEGAASFACSAYAKLTGRPAACLTIAGPGATNLLTGLWDAAVDRAPVLALTGQVKTQFLGPGAFQEIDQASAFQAVVVWSQTVLSNSNHSELMSLALKHAVVQRGVAHLILPDEVQVLPVAEAAPSGPAGRLAELAITPAAESIAGAMELIAAAHRPVIIVGHGAREAIGEVVTLAERIEAPILTTFKGKGQIGDDHPLAGGVLGRSGTPIASSLMNGADLLIVFGASFADHTGIDRSKPIIQVDFDRLALAKFHPVAVPVWGEIATTAEIFCENLPKNLPARQAAAAIREEISQQWRAWRAEKGRRAAQDRGQGISSAAIFAALTRQTPANAVIAVDVGNNAYSFGRYFECREQSILMSGYLGSIGFSFPAALGAWAAAPKRPILSVSGDGGFAQYMAEFTTAVKYGMNITHILLNNNELGKISKEQRAGQWPVWQTALHNPSFAEYAKLCGGCGIRVTRSDQLDSAIAEALAYEGPALVEVLSDAESV